MKSAVHRTSVSAKAAPFLPWVFASAAIFIFACNARRPESGESETRSSLVSGFVKSKVTGGLSNASAMAIAPDGRVFVCQRGTNGNGGGGTATAQVRVVKNGALLATPFTKITVDNSTFGCCNERGLDGIAIDPQFSSNGFVYVYYTVPGKPAHNRLSRFVAAGDVAAAAEQVVIDFDNLSNPNHNGGALHFGADGKLYIAVGNDATSSNSQSIGNRKGKILRVNADGTIPSDNPTSFPGISGTTSGANRALWAVGFRNPFTMAINPATGRIFVNDVGENSREEIDDLIRGRNYGWPSQEGMNGATNINYTRPVKDYGHGDQGACAIAGGTFYHPSVNTFGATYVDKYFFADYCGGWIRMLDPSTGAVTGFDSGFNAPVDLRIGPDGALFVLARGSGELWKVQGTKTVTQSLVVSTSTLTVPEGSSGTFTVKLASQPSADVVVDLVRATGPTSVSISPASLTFTAANWNVADDVVVSAAEDTTTGNLSAEVTCSSAGLSTESVGVTVIDNDGVPFAPTAQISLPHDGDTVSGTNTDFFGQGMPGGTRVLAINAGGGVSGVFVADTGFSGGTVSAGTTAAIDLSTVVNPAPQGVYQKGRWGNTTYTLSGLSAGATQTVRLHFAEYVFAAAGKRRFNVAINDAPVLSSFDIFAAAGAAKRAVIREFAATADGAGQIRVSFADVLDHAMINGLEVYRGGSTVVRAEFYVDGVLKFTDVHNSPPDHYHYLGSHSSWDTTTLANGAHTLQLTVYDLVGASGSHQIDVTVAN